MGSDWSYVPLGDLVTLQRGHDLPSQERIYGEVPIMGSSGITGYHSQIKCEGPGVIIGRSGNSMGVVSYVVEDYWPLNTCLYVTDFKGNEPRYIYYLLNQVNFDQFNSGSAQKSLNRNAVYPFKIWATKNIETQKSIGELLSQYETSIELNKQTNQTLEQMAQALFKSWFVDFDPVIDNALAAGIEIPEALQHRVEIRKTAHALQKQNPNIQPLPAATQRLFPSEFEHCGDDTLGIQGWIPKEWKVKDIKSLTLKLTKGTTASKKQVADSHSEVVVPFLKVRDLTERNEIKVGGLDSIPLDVHENQLKRSIIHSGDLLISIAGTIGRITIVPENLNNSNCNQALAIIRCKEISVRNFVYYSFRLNSMQSYFESKIVQAVQANLSLGSIGEAELVLPDNKLLEIWNSQNKTILSKLGLNRDQNAALEKMRDTLLPKLISGEVQLDSKAQELMDA